MLTYRYAELSPRVRSRRMLVLHRQSVGAATNAACRSYRRATERRRQDAKELSFQYRRRCRLAGSSACGVDIAAGRRGFFHTLAADQISFRKSIAEAGTAERGP